MPYYEYETIPSDPNQAPERFEIRQKMSDEPLSVHPETGEKVKRVYSSFSVTNGSSGSCEGGSCDMGGSSHSHGGGCGCGCCCGM